MTLEVRSAGFAPNENIPRKFTCDGEDVSPALEWSGLPAGVKSIAVIVDDPDAPNGLWVHWLVCDLPADTTKLGENQLKTDTLPNGAKQGLNDFRKVGYNGPCPPKGKAHRYFFKVYALDNMLGLSPHFIKPNLEKAMKGHILAEGQMFARYGR